MASSQAVSAVCETVIGRLRSSFSPDLFDGQNVDFIVAQAPELLIRAQNEAAGVTLYLYRVDQNPSQRNTPIRFLPKEAGNPPRLFVDMAFLLTAWANEASLQQKLTGWMLQVMAANPLLTAATLNQVMPGVFQPDETVEVVPLNLTIAEIQQIWQGIGSLPYSLSIPYQTRNLAVDSLPN